MESRCAKGMYSVIFERAQASPIQNYFVENFCRFFKRRSSCSATRKHSAACVFGCASTHLRQNVRRPWCVVVGSCEGDLAASCTRAEFFLFSLRHTDLVLTLYHCGEEKFVDQKFFRTYEGEKFYELWGWPTKTSNPGTLILTSSVAILAQATA